MENDDAIEALAALAHEHRMAAFRLLVRAGQHGLAAGEIAGRLELPASSLSFHLAQLTRAGLLRSGRKSRHVFYAVDYPAVRGLLDFLMDDCCAGLPELAGPPSMPRGVNAGGPDSSPPDPTRP